MPIIEPINYQTVWIVEFNPIPPHSYGGYDWFYNLEDAQSCFKEHLRDNGATGFDSHEIGLYSVHLPVEWSKNEIYAWCQDHADCLPRYIDTIAPAQAGE